jgi:hypothetical protein
MMGPPIVAPYWRTSKPVRARSGDSIDERTGERTLSHVERSDEYLDLVDRLERDGLGTRILAGRPRYAVDVTGDAAVDLNRVQGRKLAAHGVLPANVDRLRDGSEQSRKVAVEERKVVDDLTGHGERRSTFIATRVGSNRYGRQDRRRLFRKCQVDRDPVAERQCERVG